MKSRNKLLAQIHIEKNKQGIDTETYEALVYSVAGVTSCKEIKAIPVLHCVLKAIRKDRPSPHHAKVIALWHSLHRAGVVKDSSYDALNKWVKRQSGIESLHWCDGWVTSNLIEALKAWARRYNVRYDG